jgi:hypothetical protein
MVITNRDRNLFKMIATYGMLSTTQINLLCFGGIAQTTVLRRLRFLEAEKYVSRMRGLESQDTLWVLLEKGAAESEVLIPKRHYSKNLLEHDFKLTSLRIALEGSGLSHSWIPEHEIRSSIFRNNDFRTAKDKLIPDGIMGIEVDSKKQSLAIELELTLKNKDKMKQTLTRYKEKEGIVGVWYIAPTNSLLNSILNVWRGIRVFGNETKLYLSVLDDVIKSPLDSKVFGSGQGKVASELWAPKPAYPSAHRVSKEIEQLNIPNDEVSKENHAPILQNVS